MGGVEASEMEGRERWTHEQVPNNSLIPSPTIIPYDFCEVGKRGTALSRRTVFT